jgi:hypothetical protein
VVTTSTLNSLRLITWLPSGEGETAADPLGDAAGASLRKEDAVAAALG